MPDPDYDDERPKVDNPAAAPQPGPPGRGEGASEGMWWLEPSSSPDARPAPPAPPAGYLGAPPPTLIGPPAPAQGPPRDNGKATAALVLGIVGLALWALGLGLLFVANLPCSILAWIFGVQGQRRVREGETTLGEGAAKAGVILGIIGVVLGVLVPAAILTVLVFA